MSMILICISSSKMHNKWKKMWGKNEHLSILFSFDWRIPHFNSPRVEGAGPRLLCRWDKAILSAGSCCMALITSSHSCSYTTTSLHKSIIYGSCFPKIGVRKASGVLDGESTDGTSFPISLACLGLYHHHNDQGTQRSHPLFCPIFSLWMLRAEFLKICKNGTNTAY